MDRLSCRRFDHNAVRLQLHALAYNLGNFMRTLALPDAVEQWSLTSLREKLIKIGAKIVRHGGYVTFQMAEVAIPRDLFADILRRIDRLRPNPKSGMTVGRPITAGRSRDRCVSNVVSNPISDAARAPAPSIAHVANADRQQQAACQSGTILARFPAWIGSNMGNPQINLSRTGSIKEAQGTGVRQSTAPPSRDSIL